MNILHLYEIQCLDYTGEWCGYFYTSPSRLFATKKTFLRITLFLMVYVSL